MLLLPQLLLSSASADLSAAQPTLSLPLVRRRRHHPRATAHAARHLSQAAPLPTTEAGPFFGSVPSRLLRTQTPTLAHALAPRDSFIPPLATDPSQPLPLAAAQHRAQVSDDYVAPVTLGVGRGAQTFLLVADTGSNPNPNPNPNRLPQPEPWPSWPWP